MANTNNPFGLSPINQNGTPWSGQFRLAYFPASQTGNIFVGDPLVALGGGDANGVPAYGIASAGAGNRIDGSFIGVGNGPAGSGSTLLQSATVYRAASVANYGYIVDDPNCLFAIQEDSNGGAISSANAEFSNANLVAGSGGSTYTGRSSWQIQSSSAGGAGNTTYQVTLLGLLRVPGMAIGNYAVWVTRLTNAGLWSTTGV